jgi:hypothetical protein
MAPRRRTAPGSGRIGEFVRLAVLVWSATLLTASYAGMLPKMDPTFIASIFTGSLAWYGISKIERSEEKVSSVRTNTRKPKP